MGREAGFEEQEASAPQPLAPAYGSLPSSNQDQRKSRALIAAGVAGSVLTVIALLAARSDTQLVDSPKPSVALQMEGLRQLQTSMLRQTPEQMEKIRKLLDGGTLDFTLEDKQTAVGGSVANKVEGPGGQGLHQTAHQPQKPQLQKPGIIHLARALGLSDKVESLQGAEGSGDRAATPQEYKSRADEMNDKMVLMRG